MTINEAKRTQNRTILFHLKAGGSISAAEAFRNYGITRLSARIWDIRAAGYFVKVRRVSGTNRDGKNVTWNEYFLVNKVDPI